MALTVHKPAYYNETKLKSTFSLNKKRKNLNFSEQSITVGG